MYFNVISIIGLVLAIIIIKNLRSELIIRWLSIILLVYKTSEYVFLNLTEGLTFPVEISTISYFIFSIVCLFRIEKLYHVASFFALISGIGFFAYYSIFGFVSNLYFGIGRHIIATISHGILLVGGAYLFRTNDFRDTKDTWLYMTILAIISHASIFYLDSIKGTTFIYFLIRPEFLYFGGSVWITYLMMIVYYLLLVYGFKGLVWLFYRTNSLIARDVRRVA